MVPWRYEIAGVQQETQRREAPGRFASFPSKTGGSRLIIAQTSSTSDTSRERKFAYLHGRFVRLSGVEGVTGCLWSPMDGRLLVLSACSSERSELRGPWPSAGRRGLVKRLKPRLALRSNQKANCYRLSPHFVRATRVWFSRSAVAPTHGGDRRRPRDYGVART